MLETDIEKATSKLATRASEAKHAIESAHFATAANQLTQALHILAERERMKRHPAGG